MPLHETMPEVISRHLRANARIMMSKDEEAAMSVYAAEFARTGFQGGLNYYRSATLSPPPPQYTAQICALAGRPVEVPAAFISGARDWGVYQMPGAERKMQEVVCRREGGKRGMDKEDYVLIEGAGHWVQQEAPERVVQELVRFLGKVTSL
jgi:pimeloyl-ACP methyl ester carboxylesterase